MNESKMPLVITRGAILFDPALQKGARGARKICVTELYESKEFDHQDPYWYGSETQTPVVPMSDTELAVFTNETVQDRHYHKQGTEIYTVLEGQFTIEIENETFTLTAGETVIVPQNAVHEVDRDSSFIAQVVTVHCGGISDKFVVN